MIMYTHTYIHTRELLQLCACTYTGNWGNTYWTDKKKMKGCGVQWPLPIEVCLLLFSLSVSDSAPLPASVLVLFSARYLFTKNSFAIRSVYPSVTASTSICTQYLWIVLLRLLLALYFRFYSRSCCRSHSCFFLPWAKITSKHDNINIRKSTRGILLGGSVEGPFFHVT